MSGTQAALEIAVTWLYAGAVGFGVLAVAVWAVREAWRDTATTSEALEE